MKRETQISVIGSQQYWYVSKAENMYRHCQIPYKSFKTTTAALA